MIKIYDTAKQEIVWLQPGDETNVRLYVCGPTVYDVPHIGNARTAVVFDLLFRMLRKTYGGVHYARNYTDIDDKIIARAAELGIGIDELTERTIAQYEEAMAALNVLEPTTKPRATEHLDAIRTLIDKLIAKGFAYVSEGHVLFDMRAYADTQLMSKAKMTLLAPNNTGLRQGARVEVASYKRDPRDFVLWKPSKVGEPSYPGPTPEALPGRPGWHIECSAMIPEALGSQMIDIHGGGNDLIFPHHQCEVMQSEGAHDHVLARHWMHSGMLTVDGQKMSKSAGNFVTVPDVLKRFDGEVLRYFYLMGHYHQPLDFTWEKLTEAKQALTRLYRALRLTKDVEPLAKYQNTRVLNHLRYNLSTTDALATMHEFADGLLTSDKTLDPHAIKQALLQGAEILGILQHDPEAWFHRDLDASFIASEIERRRAARDQRDFTLADQIRADLEAGGVALEDLPGGITIWHAL